MKEQDVPRPVTFAGSGVLAGQISDKAADASIRRLSPAKTLASARAGRRASRGNRKNPSSVEKAHRAGTSLSRFEGPRLRNGERTRTRQFARHQSVSIHRRRALHSVGRGAPAQQDQSRNQSPKTLMCASTRGSGNRTGNNSVADLSGVGVVPAAGVKGG